MRKLLQVALGILAAIGGFVDIGDLVFNVQAGAAFRYELVWAVIVGVIGIILYAEMSGRVAAVTGRPVMTVVRQRMGATTGLAVLAASLLLCLLTLGAEVGGVALILQLFTDSSYPMLILLAVLGLALVIWILPFEWLERIFGYSGLALLVYVVAAVDLRPDWQGVLAGAVPSVHGSAQYAYFAVGLVAAALMPYEVYFYSSGAIEERWTKKDLGLNRVNTILGFGLGGLLSIALMVASAQVFNPAGVEPDLIASVTLVAQVPLGEAGLILAGFGVFFAVAGAAIDTGFSGAYNVAQFFGWEWGKYRRPAGAPRFTLTWMILLALGFMIVSTGIDPVMLTEYAVVLSVLALPFTYLPVLLTARDETFMGEHVNGRFANALGWIYLAIILVVASAAIPLLVITGG